MSKFRILMCAYALTASLSANSESLTIMSAGAVEPGLEAAVKAYEAKSQNQVSIEYGTSPQLSKKLADDQTADILVAPHSVMQAQVKLGKIEQDLGMAIGKVGVGVVVRADMQNPKIASQTDLKESVLSADSIVYNSASTGVYLEKLFEKMGITSELKDKTKRYANGDMVLNHLASGKGNEIGFGAIPEIKMNEKKGLRLVGPLPQEIQNYTSYEVGVMKTTKHPKKANELLQFLVDKNNQSYFKTAGVD